MVGVVYLNCLARCGYVDQKAVYQSSVYRAIHGYGVGCLCFQCTVVDYLAFVRRRVTVRHVYVDRRIPNYILVIAVIRDVLRPGIHGILIGDVDMDGQITIGDATIIQRHLAELTALTGDALIAADCDGDGRVAIKDVTLILKKNAEYTDEIGRVGRRVAR